MTLLLSTSFLYCSAVVYLVYWYNEMPDTAYLRSKEVYFGLGFIGSSIRTGSPTGVTSDRVAVVERGMYTEERSHGKQ